MTSLSLLICVHSQDMAHDAMLVRALESVSRQTYKDFSTIIVLNNCWPQTWQIAKKYKNYLNLTLMDKPEKNGLAAAKNIGLSRIDTDYVCYLDADNIWAPNKVETQFTYVEEHSEIDFCFHQTYDLHEDGRITDNCFFLGQYETDAAIKKRLPIENCLAHDTAMIKMSSLKTVHGYNEAIQWRGAEDHDLWIRAMKFGFRFYNMPIRLSIHSLGTSVPR